MECSPGSFRWRPDRVGHSVAVPSARCGVSSESGSPWSGVQERGGRADVERETLAVIELLNTNQGQRNETITSVLQGVATQLSLSIERQQARERLRESERRFRLAMETTTGGLWNSDLRTRHA